MSAKKPLLWILAVLTAAAFGIGSLHRANAMSSKRTDAPASSGRVWVVRSDGAQSCGMKEGESVEAGAQALQKESIPTYGSMKGNDGLMHMQVCGAPKGSINGYLIDAKDLPRALALGFKEAPKGFGGAK